MYLILLFFGVWCASWLFMGISNVLAHESFNYGERASLTACVAAVPCIILFVCTFIYMLDDGLTPVSYHKGGYAIARPFGPADKLKDLPTICRDDDWGVYRYYVRREDHSYGDQSIDIENTKVFFDYTKEGGKVQMFDSDGHWDDWGYRPSQPQRYELHVPEAMEFKPCHD